MLSQKVMILGFLIIDYNRADFVWQSSLDFFVIFKFLKKWVDLEYHKKFESIFYSFRYIVSVFKKILQNNQYELAETHTELY